MNQPSEDATHGFDSEGKRSDVEQEDVLDVTGEDGALDSCTDRNGLVWVDTTVWLLVEEVLHGFADLGDTAGAADHDHFIDLILSQGRVLEAGLKWLESLVNLCFDETFELGTSHLHIQVLRSTVVEGEIGDANRGLCGRGELNLSLLSSFTASLKSTLILHDIDATLSFELTYEEVLHLEIEVFTSESCVSVSGLNLEDTAGDFKDGDVKGAATEIVHSDDLSICLVHAEGKSRGSWLVDDTLDFKVCNLASVLCCLSLCVVEVSRDSDDGLLDCGAEVALRRLLHLGEDEGADLRR